MKIGVGVITMGVRPIKNYNLSENSELYVYTDVDKKGPSHARNQCLKYFSEKDVDYIFLFDDDCYPTMSGWEEYFINEAKESGVHYMAIPEYFKTEIYSYPESKVQYWAGNLGCFVFQDKECLDKIGGYNTEYDRYGYEDAARSSRAHKAGMTGKFSGFPFPIRGIAYIHSEDVFGENPTPNILHEDKMEYIRKNAPIYQKEINSEQIFYEYRK